MPFDCRTPVGYLITCFVQSYAFYIATIDVCTILSLLIGISLIFMSIIDDVGEELSIENESFENKIEFEKKFIEIFQLNNNIKQLCRIKCINHEFRDPKIFLI